MSSPTSSDSYESSISISSDPSFKTSDVFQTSTMPINRSGGRDVHIYDAKNPTVVFGGLILNNGVTNANLYSMLGIFMIFEEPFPLQDEELFHLQDEKGTKIQKNDDELQPGKYYIV